MYLADLCLDCRILRFVFYRRSRLEFTKLIIMVFFKMFGRKADLIAENFSLCQQLKVYKRKHREFQSIIQTAYFGFSFRRFGLNGNPL